MKYKTLLFDADGTLYDFEKSERRALKEFHREFCQVCEFEVFNNVYEIENSLLWTAFEENKITASEIKIKRFENTMNRLGIKFENAEKLSSFYLNELSQCGELLEGALNLILKLSQCYNLFIITNGLWDVQKKRIGESELFKYFDGMIVSEKVGYAKPHKKIFDEVFSLASHPHKSEVLIIGDSLSSDIKGGMDYHIDSCWYNSSGLSAGSKYYPTYVVKDFKEMEDLLLSSDF